MNEERTEVALVAYYNTEPFLYGLETAGKYSLHRAIPSACAQLFEDNKVSIALVPVAAYFEMKQSKIISSYGICCTGSVKTVAVLSNEPLEELHTIYLDSHSRTSVQLLRVLLRGHWKHNPKLIKADVMEVKLNPGEGVLMIGDKVFDQEGSFKFVYDLGEEWYRYKKLPFVFAVWIGNNEMSSIEEQELNKHLQWGVDQIPKMMDQWSEKYNRRLNEYLTRDIKYEITPTHLEALKTFEEEIQKCPLGALQ